MRGSVEKDAPIVLCGNGCGHDHESANGPSGCCTRKPEHGPYLYFCQPCHDDWAAASPERVAQIRRLAQRVTPSEVTPVIRAYDPATHVKGCDCAACCAAAKSASERGL